MAHLVELTDVPSILKGQNRSWAMPLSADTDFLKGGGTRQRVRCSSYGLEPFLRNKTDLYENVSTSDRVTSSNLFSIGFLSR